jgi:DNA modification methylase
VWNQTTGNLVGGHQRLKILAARGDSEVTVSVVELGEQDEAALNVALNKISGDWDMKRLGDVLSELDGNGYDATLTGFDVDELADILGGYSDDDEDPVPEPPANPESVLGEVYELGPHRLMCGDSTNAEHVAKLMGGHTAHITVTSPPYNAGFLDTGQKETERKYANDDDDRTTDEYTGFLNAAMGHAINASRVVFWNIQVLANNRVSVVDFMHRWRLHFKDVIYWVKNTGAPHISKGVLNSRVELVLAFDADESPTRAFPNAQFSQGTGWNVIEGGNAVNNEYSDIHKATFPTYLPRQLIIDFSPINGYVYDPFGGSGTTLIAAEETKRVCYMMELDPGYCDVIRQRYANYEGT